MKQFFMLLGAAALLSACSPSTQIVKSWSEPGAGISSSASGNKALIIAMVKDETSRRVVEDNLAMRMKGKGVPSYSVLSEDMLKAAKDNHLVDVVNQGAFTHVILVRLADVEKETSYVPGTTTGYYGGYGRYYGYGAAMYSTPGYYTTDKNYFVETMVYSVSPDKLIWSGTTKTVNPSKLDKTIGDVAEAVTNEMKRTGFLK